MSQARSVRHHESKLRRVLERALLVALAAPTTAFVAEACSTDSGGAIGNGEVDASIADASGADAAVFVDAGPCAPNSIYVDAQAPDGGIECGVFQLFSCGLTEPVLDGGNGQEGGLTVYDDCFFSLNNCPDVCPGSLFFNCHIYGDACDGGVINSASPMIVECASCPNGVGRRPRGLVASRRKNKNALGNYFAQAAHLEAASVHAFRILRRELSSHGAPPDLLRAAARAERDEVKHTKMMARLGRAHGGRPERVRVVRGGHRSLEAIALENAVEGCVRETFGALVAMWQAERAENLDVARAMREIAADETRHAALAWTVAAWADAQLDDDARERVNAAKNKAILDLEKEIAPPHPELVRRAGLPNRATQRRLLRALGAELGA